MLVLYDVIIIGAGNAGSVLASRLSECPDLKVLLLEAGVDRSANPVLRVPTGGAALCSNSTVDWNYKTTPQEGYGGRTIVQSRGKGLGGSMLVNLNRLTFPDRHSIDNWEKLGNKGWSWEEMRPYYQKFQTFHESNAKVKKHLDFDTLRDRYHGKSGPDQTSFGGCYTDVHHAWVRTFANLGYKSQVDVLSGDSIGAQNHPGTIEPSSRTRSYVSGAYLTDEVKNRPNLRIITGAHVEKLLLRAGSPAQIQCIRYATLDGKVQYTQAAREVILCAGAFNSPQILELSGIGSPEVLSKHSVRSFVDLPGVGENLQDHANVGISYETEVPTLDFLNDPKATQAAIKVYKTKRSGPETMDAWCSSFMPCVGGMSNAGKDELAATLDEHVSNAFVSRGLQKQYDLIRSTVEDPARSSAQYVLSPIQLSSEQSSARTSEEERAANYLTLMASLSHPFSRGSCHISSSDPTQPPVINPRYFTHPADVEIQTRHLQNLETVAATKPLQDLLKATGRTIPAALNLKSRDCARELIKTGSTTYHPSSTCSMLPREDGGVVDARLRVYGVQGLRVVDASVFPLIPRGDIRSSVYAVAERAADIIKEDLDLGIDSTQRK